MNRNEAAELKIVETFQLLRNHTGSVRYLNYSSQQTCVNSLLLLGFVGNNTVSTSLDTPIRPAVHD